jgi:hypothetical protein
VEESWSDGDAEEVGIGHVEVVSRWRVVDGSIV